MIERVHFIIPNKLKLKNAHVSTSVVMPPFSFLITMFIAALFVIAKTWKQPKYPSTKEWIRKMWYIYTMKYYTAEKNNDILKFA